MPNLVVLRAAVFKLFAKNRWGQNLPPSSARVIPTYCAPEHLLKMHNRTPVYCFRLLLSGLR